MGQKKMAITRAIHRFKENQNQLLRDKTFLAGRFLWFWFSFVIHTKNWHQKRSKAAKNGRFGLQNDKRFPKHLKSFQSNVCFLKITLKISPKKSPRGIRSRKSGGWHPLWTWTHKFFLPHATLKKKMKIPFNPPSPNPTPTKKEKKFFSVCPPPPPSPL